MGFKVSKFNYITENDDDILLINTFKGSDSLCRVESENKQYVLDMLSNGTQVDDKSNMFSELVKRGFLVDEDCDEEARLKYTYLRIINDSMLFLTILPTEQCNYRCKYCYESFERGRLSEETQNAIVEFVKKNIHNYTGLHVAWFGGEPLIALDIIESLSKKFIQICKDRRIPYISDITTNGYCLNAEVLKKLYGLHVTHYTLTIDGIRETHNKQKPLANGDATFDTVIQNLISIRDTIKNNFFTITIRTNFTPEIYQHLGEYVDFFYDNFNDDPRFRFFARPAGNWGGEAVKDFEEKLFENNGFLSVLKGMIDYPKTLKYDIHSSFMGAGGSLCVFSNLNSYLIDSQGNIRKCSCELDNDENIIGKMTASGEMDIDLDKQARWVNYYQNDGICTDCFFAPACLQNNCLANKALDRCNTNECHLYEKEQMEYLLKLINKTDRIEVIK